MAQCQLLADCGNALKLESDQCICVGIMAALTKPQGISIGASQSSGLVMQQLSDYRLGRYILLGAPTPCKFVQEFNDNSQCHGRSKNK